MFVHRVKSSLWIHQKHVFTVVEQFRCVTNAFHYRPASLVHRKCTGIVEKTIPHQLLFQHHEVKLALQHLQVQIHGPKPVPPAHMIAYQQHRVSIVGEMIFDGNRMIPRSEQIPRIVLKKRINYEVMPGFQHVISARLTEKIYFGLSE